MAEYEVDIMSVKSIERLRRDLRDYKRSLKSKVNKLVTALYKLGLEVIEVHVNESPLGHHIHVKVEREGSRAVLIATGDLKISEGYEPFNTLLAIEFGAGIHYNHDENPKADEFGYGVGTFPEQTHAFQEEGWYYFDESDQKWKHSFGVQATMPMFHASEEMRKQLVTIAREVFADA